jgi:hypothetical protein
MSDTPETDAEHAQFPMGGFTLDFARKLERERDEALSDLEFRRDLFKLQEQQLNDVRAERDEARETAERYRLEANAMMMQRDRLAEALRIVMADYRLDGRVSAEADILACDALAAVKGGSDE